MQDLLEAVIELQPNWTAANTDLMKQRGRYVRKDGPSWIKSQLADLQAVMPSTVDDLHAEGRDGAGQRSATPWFRLYSRSRSPKARFGWYLVYLFDSLGECAYLSLNQGTTLWTNGDLRPLPPELLAQRVSWARKMLVSELANGPFLNHIDLHANHPLALGYERGNVAAVQYDAGHVPPAPQLLDDLREMSLLLGRLYEAMDEGDVPGDQPAEVAEANSAIEGLAGKKSRRVGFRPNAAQRKAIEMRAMAEAKSYLKTSDWDVKDVSKNSPFDFKATKGGATLSVEVKGTTSQGEQVLLTRGEVEHMTNSYPNTALIVVSQISLSGPAEAPTASGGVVAVISPWQILEPALLPIGFQYTVPTHLASDVTSKLDFVLSSVGLTVEVDSLS